MSADCFIDTHVFIYPLDSSDPAKQSIAKGIVRHALLHGSGCTSLQVVHECMNTVLRRAHVKLSPAQAGAYLEAVLAPLVQVPGTVALVQRAILVLFASCCQRQRSTPFTRARRPLCANKAQWWPHAASPFATQFSVWSATQPMPTRPTC